MTTKKEALEKLRTSFGPYVMLGQKFDYGILSDLSGYVERVWNEAYAAGCEGAARAMPEMKTAKELYPDAIQQPDVEWAMCCEGKNMYNAAIDQCRRAALDEAERAMNVKTI